MRCTGTGSGNCCVAFDNGVCSNDLTCTETNFVATEENSYTCSKSVSVSFYPSYIGGDQGVIRITASKMHVFSIVYDIVCDPGYMLNSSQCSCILTDTCVANTPCANNGT